MSPPVRALLLLACFLLGCSPGDPGSPQRPRPNVLFVSIDDLRPELNCYGVSRARTPHLDRFAQGALRFTRAYCQQAMCSPSRTSLLTGLRPESTGVDGQKEHFRENLPDLVTLPQHFKQAGWRALSFGKVFHGNRRDPVSWSAPEYTPPREAIYADPANQALNTPRTNGPAVELLDLPDDAWRDGMVTREVLGALREVGDEPFFFAVGFHKPHLPFAAPARYGALYPDGSLSLPPGTAPEGASRFGLHDSPELRSYSDVPQSGPLSEAFQLELARAYLACVSYVDAQVGALLDELESLGLADDTIVVVWGDHGFYVGDHGMWGKTGTFEVAARVPLLVRVPAGLGGAGSGASTDGIVELVDLYPTLCALAGLPVPGHLEGASFAPLFEDPTREWKSAAFTWQPLGPAVGLSIRTQRWRFTTWRTAERELDCELYDVGSLEGAAARSPNLARDPEHAATVEDLRARLAAGWRAALPPS